MSNTYTELKDAIKEKLDEIDKIQEVSDTPKLKFAGYPAVTITPSEDESDYETDSENMRIYVFNVGVFYEVQGTDINTAVDSLYDLVDDILDAFDQDQQLAGTSIDLPARYTMIAVEPTSGAWGEIPDTKLITKLINLRIKISVDIS